MSLFRSTIFKRGRFMPKYFIRCGSTQIQSESNLSSPYFQVSANLTNNLQFIDTQKDDPIPIYRCIDEDGHPMNDNWTMPMSAELAIKLYETMIKVAICDDIFYKLVRTGQFSFYIANVGEEAVSVGSAAAWNYDDVIFTQYRELGVFLWRGYTIQQCADHNYSNIYSHGRGRNNPICYGSKELNLATIKAPLSCQIPQAAGAGYALKLEGKDAAAVCYFGDGAASEGDFHAGLNMAATMDSQVIWVARNNGYAISTPTKDQYRGDGIASRSHGYGLVTSRFDGNDIFAVYEACKEARRICTEEKRPVLLEAMTYRGSHHSTSDDAATYRDVEEQQWWNTVGTPLHRMKLFLINHSLWDEEREVQLREEITKEVMQASEEASKVAFPHWKHLFTDVYSEMTPHIKSQSEELETHLQKWGNDEYYSVHKYSKQM